MTCFALLVLPDVFIYFYSLMANVIEFKDIMRKELPKVGIAFLSRTLILFQCRQQSQLTVLASLDLPNVARSGEVTLLCRRVAKRF